MLKKPSFAATKIFLKENCILIVNYVFSLHQIPTDLFARLFFASLEVSSISHISQYRRALNAPFKCIFLQITFILLDKMFGAEINGCRGQANIFTVRAK